MDTNVYDECHEIRRRCRAVQTLVGILDVQV